MKYELYVERHSIAGVHDFHPTGKIVETDDPHAAVMAAQAADGRSYCAHPAGHPLLAAGRRLVGRLAGR